MDARRRRLALSRGAQTTVKLAMAIIGVSLMAPPSAMAQGSDCVPACRDGYLCHDGQCIEACNPPCPDGEQCVGGGQCVPKDTGEPSYAVVNTGATAGAVDSGGKPPVALPATFVGIGGFLMIAGGVTFGTSEWDGYYGEYWGTGQWVGIGLITMGSIMLVTATPFLVIRTKERKEWERQHACGWRDNLAITPILAPSARNRTYGLALRAGF